MDKYLFSYATASDQPIKRGLIRLVELATGQPKLNRMDVLADDLRERVYALSRLTPPAIAQPRRLVGKLPRPKLQIPRTDRAA
jgi:hypothetical protein